MWLTCASLLLVCAILHLTHSRFDQIALVIGEQFLRVGDAHEKQGQFYVGFIKLGLQGMRIEKLEAVQEPVAYKVSDAICNERPEDFELLAHRGKSSSRMEAQTLIVLWAEPT